jgi:hypothetical protein
MENFPEVCGRMLREFEIQLNHNPSPINNTRLIQLMAINMFAIDNTELKGWPLYCLPAFLQCFFAVSWLSLKTLFRDGFLY